MSSWDQRAPPSCLRPTLKPRYHMPWSRRRRCRRCKYHPTSRFFHLVWAPKQCSKMENNTDSAAVVCLIQGIFTSFLWFSYSCIFSNPLSKHALMLDDIKIEVEELHADMDNSTYVFPFLFLTSHLSSPIPFYYMQISKYVVRPGRRGSFAKALRERSTELVW